MSQLTQREAARAWSIPWTTFRRKVQAGELSIDADKRVDSAEMVRVFGEPRTSTNGPVGTSTGPAADPIEVVRLKAENEGLKRELGRLESHLTDLRGEILRLTGPKADAQTPPKTDATGRRVLIALGVFTALVITAIALDLPSRLGHPSQQEASR